MRGLTDGLGADVAIEAVGVPASFELCTELVRPGGHVANIGVHGKAATLHLESLWIRNVTITTGLVDTYSTPTLLRLLAAGQIDAGGFATHHFGLDEFMEAYDVFGRAGDTGARQGGPDTLKSPGPQRSPGPSQRWAKIWGMPDPVALGRSVVVGPGRSRAG